MIRLGRGGRRVGAALALVVAIAVVVVLVVTSGSSPQAGGANPNGSSGTIATVGRRDLIQTDTEAGTLSYSRPQTVYNRLGGTVTWLPSAGQLIKPGGTLYDVDSAPVILMNGSTPAFRTLSSAADPGPDVLELNRNLVALGFNPDGIVADDVWQPATTAGVELFQASLGESETGSLPIGKVVFLPGDQLVSTVEGTLGGSATRAAVEPAAPEFVSFERTTTSSSRQKTAVRQPAGKVNPRRGRRSQTLAALLALLKVETTQLRAELQAARSRPSTRASSPHTSSSSNGGSSTNAADASGGSGSSGTSASQAILETTSTRLVVTVDLAATVQSEARVGERVQVQLPDGDTVAGRVSAVSSVAQNPSNSDNGNGNGNGSGGAGAGNGNGNGNGSSPSTVPVTVTLSGHHSGAGLDQASVSVSFAQHEARNVLSVPVTALLAVSGGNYAVQEANPPYRLIPITPGLFAAGYVQIAGAGIYPGLRVTDSQG